MQLQQQFALGPQTYSPYVITIGFFLNQSQMHHHVRRHNTMMIT